MIDRYGLVGEYEWTRIGMLENGDYVLASDYQALEAKLARLVVAGNAAIHSMENLCDYYEDHAPEIDKLKAAIDAAKGRG